MPAQLVRFPRVSTGTWTFEGGASTGILTAQVAVIMIPAGQGQYETNFIAAVKMMDNLWHAIANHDLNTDDTAISKLWANYEVTAELLIAGGTFWAVVAEVFGRGRIPNVLV